jgi:putative ubiquitin-RnfH superfamily antitoxin RatB of RatAB toxin-antitoxin module
MQKIAKTAVAVLSLAIAASALTAMPAQAADAFSVNLSASTDLVRAGDNITATLANVPTGEGVYVRFCAAPAVAGNRPTACLGQGAWATPDSNMWGVGGVDISAPVAVAVQQSFTANDQSAVNCDVQGCGVFVRRDHMGPGDLSLDTFVPVTFAPVFGVTLSKSENLAVAADSIDVTVAGLTGNQGVYVRLCEAPAVVGDRPENCFGQGDWLSHDPAMVQVGASTSATAQALAVKGSFTSGSTTIDCHVVSCGVFVRLDHTDPTNKALDTFTPVTFAAPIVVVAPPAANPAHNSVTRHGKHLVVTLVGLKGQKAELNLGGRVVKVTLKSNNPTLRFAAPKAKSAKVVVKVSGKTKLNKKVKLG